MTLWWGSIQPPPQYNGAPHGPTCRLPIHTHTMDSIKGPCSPPPSITKYSWRTVTPRSVHLLRLFRGTFLYEETYIILTCRYIFSLGFTIAQLEKSNDRGIRLEAIHMRGIEDMEEEDIMQYFNEFQPTTIEWIDDESCKFINSCFMIWIRNREQLVRVTTRIRLQRAGVFASKALITAMFKMSLTYKIPLITSSFFCIFFARCKRDPVHFTNVTYNKQVTLLGITYEQPPYKSIVICLKKSDFIFVLTTNWNWIFLKK